MSDRLDHEFNHRWHVAINRYNTNGKFERWMYEAKSAADEVPRLQILFANERERTLPSTHQQCSHSPGKPIADNHLTCCLGVKCRECPHLMALEAIETGNPAEIDQAKAWTCATHIISKGGDFANEGYLLTVSDRMFWDQVYQNLAGDNHE